MTYNVFSGMLNPTQSINQWTWEDYTESEEVADRKWWEQLSYRVSDGHIVMHVCTSCFCWLLCFHVHVSFEHVFDIQTKQEEVFDVVARPVIDKLATVSLVLLWLVVTSSLVLWDCWFAATNGIQSVMMLFQTFYWAAG